MENSTTMKDYLREAHTGFEEHHRTQAAHHAKEIAFHKAMAGHHESLAEHHGGSVGETHKAMAAHHETMAAGHGEMKSHHEGEADRHNGLLKMALGVVEAMTTSESQKVFKAVGMDPNAIRPDNVSGVIRFTAIPRFGAPEIRKSDTDEVMDRVFGNESEYRDNQI